jgi:hypothetical protein
MPQTLSGLLGQSWRSGRERRGNGEGDTDGDVVVRRDDGIYACDIVDQGFELQLLSDDIMEEDSRSCWLYIGLKRWDIEEYSESDES